MDWLCVLGNPVGHSLSPAMHEAGFAATGMPARYLAFEVAFGRFAGAVQGLGCLGFRGANVTVPFKEQAFRLAEQRGTQATLAGSANTLRFDTDGIFADSTDGPGFFASLRDALDWSPRGASIVLLGAGGAARGIAAAALTLGAAKVTVANRTVDRAESLANDLHPVGTIMPLALADAGLSAVLGDADLVVQCTSVGLGAPDRSVLSPERMDDLRQGSVVADIVYRPEKTAFLRLASDRGLITVGGLGMLAHQAALSWQVWFGEIGPVEVFLHAAREALASEMEHHPQ